MSTGRRTAPRPAPRGTSRGSGAPRRAGTTARRGAAPAARPPSGRRAREAAPGRAAAAPRSRERALARVDGTDARRRGRRRVHRRLVGGLVATVLALGVLVVAVLPTPTWMQQREATQELEAELRELQEERARVEEALRRQRSPEEIERQARENGYQRPGEEIWNTLPTPLDPIGLPATWPFTGVERSLGVG